jgi:hypothetical protein
MEELEDISLVQSFQYKPKGGIKMTLGMLQEHIQELVEEAECLGLDPDELKVAVALQPNWPLAAKITNFKIINDENPIVWVATTQTDINGSPYAPKEVWDEC